MHPIVDTLRNRGVECDDSALTCAMYAHDASNYRITPIAVVFPRDARDVTRTMQACHAAGIAITPRGAGTGMAGNTIGPGIVLELRRHLSTRIDVDPSAACATVDPGVVLDDLQRAAAPHGLMFGPDPSSRSRATIGGMIGNDACGNHSVAYGRTSDHVLSLELVLADGTRAIATRDGLRAIDEAGRVTVQRIVDQLRATAVRNAAALGSEFARCPRQVSGYAAHRLADGFDIARLLVGSEGSLAVVVSATVALVPAPTATQLLVIGYRSLIEAARDVPLLLAHRPAAIEAMDTAIVATMRARRGEASVPDMPDGDAWLYVEFADTVATADLDAVAAQVHAAGRAVSASPITDAARRRALWRVREDGAGLASNLLDGRRGKPGWEDAAVPPERLAEYLERMAALADAHGYSGVLYGHFGAGCVHVRYDFDTETDAGRAAMRAFIRDAAHIVADCGGSMSGEHGDGRARGELLPIMYSEGAMHAFRDIKAAFDPTNLLNPHVIVDAPPLDHHMPTRVRAGGTAFRLAADHGDLAEAASRCVGVGRCVTSTISAMCPTYDVTHDERDSTRGRARAIQDIFNEGGLSTGDALEALDDCLACKACSTDCPTGVDMATYKAEVLHRHYRHRIRPRSHYVLGWLPSLTALAQPIAGIANALLRSDAVYALLTAAGGLTRRRPLPRIHSRAQVRALAAHAEEAPHAVLFVDSTTRGFRTEVAGAALRVLSAAGIRTAVTTEGCCGLTWISTGQLDTAARKQRALLDSFDALPAGIPIIVLEPSCAATLAHDLPGLIDDPRAASVAARIRTFAQALSELAPGWQWPALPDQVVLQPHCHERAGFTDDSQTAALTARGVAVQEAVGCCGMAGAYGYEAQHYDMSVQVAARSLLPAVDAADDGTPVLADGFGCACQIGHLRPGTEPLHLAQLLDRAL